MPTHNLAPGHQARCQICSAERLDLVLDLGHHPPCDSLLTLQQLNEAEKVYPLRFMRCLECGLAQIDYVVPPEELFFPEYPYRSGITGTLAGYLQSIATALVADYGLGKDSFVVDLGSNDGTLLQGFKTRGMRVLGVEPTNVAGIAIGNGIPTVQEFFSLELAQRLQAEHGPAQVVTAANMFAHVARLGDLIRGVEELLVDGGIFLSESHYLLDLLERTQYDSIYHEHLKYYSLRSIRTLFSHYDFTVVDAERIPNYGGSIRVYAMKGKGRPVTERLERLVAAEVDAGLDGGEVFEAFAERVRRSKLELQHLLVDINRQGEAVVGIGCPGRASTLLNYCNVDPVLMPYIAEQSSSLKLGLYLPGKHIPVVDEQRMMQQQPEYAVLLSWHYGEPIVDKLRMNGLASKIIVPLPDVRVLE